MRARELTRGASRVNLRGMRSHGKTRVLSSAVPLAAAWLGMAGIAAALVGCEPPPPPPAADTSARAAKSAAPATPAKPLASPGGSAAPAASAAPAGSAAPADTGAPIDPSITATSTTLDTSAGPVVVHAVHHGTVWIELGGKVLWVDPW